ncbi:MAG: cytochrome c3 family protein, partial [Deltaproteobacteria bacterium]
EKGIVLSIQRAERMLAGARTQEQKRQFSEELAALRKRKPEIIEIKPFGGKLGPERCLTCHFGIEDLSPSHPNSVFGCVSCHGGNGPDLTVTGAHMGLRGGRNPAVLGLAGTSCGSTGSELGQCHSRRASRLLDRVDNVPRSLMATNAGIISILRFQWGVAGDSRPRFGVKAVADGKSPLRAVPPERITKGTVSLADSHFRKFCATCHLWSPRPREKMGRLAGCPACHAPYAEDGRYHGCDPTINRREIGRPSTHAITNAVPDERCRACHNRSGRVGLSYHGEMESAQYGTPFVRGVLNTRTISDDRFVLELVPDIHYEKGMGCIDCHTGQDTMGDGIIHGHMEDQIEIRCEDCHGTYSESPKTMKVKKDDPLTQALIRSSPFAKPSDGDEILQTSKGRPLIHVRKTSKGFRLTSKLTGKQHPVSVITGRKNAHRIKGHSRLECDSCHSAWSPQCYGCHQVMRDWTIFHSRRRRVGGLREEAISGSSRISWESILAERWGSWYPDVRSGIRWWTHAAR